MWDKLEKGDIIKIKLWEYYHYFCNKKKVPCTVADIKGTIDHFNGSGIMIDDVIIDKWNKTSILLSWRDICRIEIVNKK